jgi:hypothetical protein
MSRFELVGDPTTSEKAPIVPAVLSSFDVLADYRVLRKRRFQMLGESVPWKSDTNTEAIGRPLCLATMKYRGVGLYQMAPECS